MGRAGGYGRDGNPGWEALEQALGAIEGAEAVTFASGQAASMALMLCLAAGRQRIVLPRGLVSSDVMRLSWRIETSAPIPAAGPSGGTGHGAS